MFSKSHRPLLGKIDKSVLHLENHEGFLEQKLSINKHVLRQFLHQKYAFVHKVQIIVIDSLQISPSTRMMLSSTFLLSAMLCLLLSTCKELMNDDMYSYATTLHYSSD